MRDRRSDLESESTALPWAEQPAIGNFKGLTWWMAVLLAVGLAAIGTLIDALASKGLGITFQVAYVLGCVAAIVLVQRRSLFGPMVQPPLIMVLVAPPLLLLFAGGSGGLLNKLMTLGTPLILSFPAMAVATVLVIAIGVARIVMQREPVASQKKPRRAPSNPVPRDKPEPGQSRRAPLPPVRSDRTGRRDGELPPRPAPRMPERSRTDLGRPAPQPPRANPPSGRLGAPRQQPPAPPRRPRYSNDDR